jgi:hypothetical protein
MDVNLDGSSDECVQDCAGTWDGNLILDECGECNGPGIAENECDCNGSKLDGCNQCLPPDQVNDDLSSDSCMADCSGEWGGNDVNDECGVCGGGNYFTFPNGLGCQQGQNNGLGQICSLPNGDCHCNGDIWDCSGECGGNDTSCLCDPGENWAGHEHCKVYSDYDECTVQFSPGSHRQLVSFPPHSPEQSHISPLQ